MRDVSIVASIYCLLFVVLTTPTGIGYFSLSPEVADGVHHFMAELIFWAAALYICATGTMGAFARQDRFGLTQHHPLLNKAFSILLILSPFLAVFWNVRFVYILLGLLALSHIRSKTPEESKIEFSQSRAVSNMVLIPLFTLALMLMTLNNYGVSSIFSFGSLATPTDIEQKADNA